MGSIAVAALKSSAGKLLIAGLFGIAAFATVYLLAGIWIPTLLTWMTGLMSVRVGQDALNNIREMGAFGVALIFGGWTFRTLLARWAIKRRAVADAASSAGGELQALATVIHRQWTQEMGRQGVAKGGALDLYWVRLASLHTGERLGVARPRNDTMGRGRLTELSVLVASIPSQQLVVLGGGGSGKTIAAMLLLLDMADPNRSHSSVPVLAPLCDWAADEQHLEEYLASRIEAEYPFLRKRNAEGDSAAKRLILEGKIVPILDGFDEMPPQQHERAIAEINAAMTGKPFVLTSRSPEFTYAVMSTGQLLTEALIIEISPLTVSQIIRYVLSRASETDNRWREVFAHLNAYPAGQLAVALSARNPVVDTVDADDFAAIPGRI
ncbi:hypothetical protein Rhe02_78380 [Rhizocola hellebori]|uniref:NACHT domain-containing protein n=1 Tax=Rhizocola hellebori TaxID=1392758 RepID=A0A8J3QIC0_9ACTN|nr:NACHT domain-containing protein [Rhizocola hellebori]GIH09771.1 hypothetical protein Rhe02_78380 [Rhizocola hellebori]